MKITKEMIQTGLPPKRRKKGFVNVVLAIWKDSNYCRTNTYIPKWMVCNTAYYHKNPDQFEGWIDLEFLIPPPFK